MDTARVFLCLVIPASYATTLLKANESDLSSKWIAVDENPLHKNFTSPSEISTTMTTLSNSSVPCNQKKKHEKYCECRKAGLVAFEPGEYVIKNGTAVIPAHNLSFGPDFYELDGEDLLICTPESMDPSSEGESHNPHNEALACITLIGLSISIVCLSLHLAAFVLVSDLRNIPGCCMACLCMCLLPGYVSFLVGLDDHIAQSRDLCIAAAFSTHFFLLSSVLWMNVMAFDVLKSLLNAAGKFRMMPSKFTFKNFYVYCLYAWGISLGFAIAAIKSDSATDFPDEYKPGFGDDMCWFNKGKALLVFFAAPVFTVICTNVVFFGMSVRIIITHRMKTADPQQAVLKRNLVMYARLAVVMGLSWVSGLLATLLNQVALWYIFTILNTCQGTFIFLAFTCSPKVKKHFSAVFRFYSRKFSVQTCSNEKYSENTGKGSDLTTSGKT